MLGADDTRATPAERLDNDVDFQPTDRRVLFGHHFAAIAGAGPLVGPVLAAQMGYLPGTMWIIFGVIFAGAVQDMVILFAVLIIVIIFDAARIWWQTLSGRREPVLAEAPFEESHLWAPSGLFPTAEDRARQAELRVGR